MIRLKEKTGDKIHYPMILIRITISKKIQWEREAGVLHPASRSRTSYPFILWGLAQLQAC